MKKKSFTLFFLLIGIFGLAQVYVPIDTADYQKRIIWAKDYENYSKKKLNSVNEKYAGEERKHLKKTYSDFFSTIKKSIKEGEFFTQNEFNSKIEEIVQKLRTNNPIIPKELNLWISKDISLNAYCTLDGTLVTHMGTFYWLENEDQLAAVISHELGHYLLEHTEKMQLRLLKNAQKNKQTVKELKNSKYNINERAFNEVKNQLYETGEYRRFNEMSADSLGYIIYKNSGDFKGNYLSTLLLMEEYNQLTPKGVKEETYKNFFTFPQQEFKEEWLKVQDFSNYNYENYHSKLDEDLLKSHPEMVERIEKLKKDFPELKNATNEKTEASDQFNKLSYKAKMQIVPNLYNRKSYGTAIYFCLYELQDEKLTEDEKIYFKQWMGKNFSALHQARKDYLFNRYVEQIDPNDENQSDSYKLFLSFLWNLNLNDLKNFADYYSQIN